ncbi:coiled-coil domain-containing protein 17 [Protopterus annectens]|uniref:coiled-coil domain-containing protein 17 n=1 Tax=Protopterus annectens TaxID=7888 RepID=UPI001CF9D16E|nr:coiled-coil domain-containing protein 17 [Protopterus annectens]
MMTDSGTFHCQHCNMTFRSLDLLDKHKEKFCIGSEIGDPSALRQRVNLSLDKGDEYKVNTLDMEAGTVTRRSEVFDNMLQHQRQRKARMRHLEPDILTEREMDLLKGYDQGVSLSRSQSLRRLTKEFQKLRMSIEESFPNAGSWQTEGEGDLQPNRELEYQNRMREMVAAHERHLADIQDRNRDLEQQREEIRRRLAEYASRDKPTTNIEQMLLELKAQEEKNQLALESLREQIELLQMDAGSKSEAGITTHSPHLVEEKEEKLQFNFIPFTIGNGSLASEISALRLAYLQNGGKDPVILAQMHDLQSEAQTLEMTTQKPGRKEKKRKLPNGTLDTELLRMELENQRLEDEILKLKLQRETRKVGDDYRDKELMDMQREHMKQMAEMQAEMEMLKKEAGGMWLRRGRWSPKLQRPPPPPPPPPPPQPPISHHYHPAMHPPAGGEYAPPFIPGAMDRIQPHVQSMSKHLLNPVDALGPSPYDPAAGFVVFYDFILGLDPTVSLVRLVAGLYSNGQEMGKPTTLPAVYCEIGRTMPYLTDSYKGNIAMLSAKQPVPRVRPFPSICLVMDLQAAGGFDSYGQEIQRLVSRGWSKLDIFDHNNQVMSGRWKVPVRTLPVQPALSMGQLNGIPQVGNAEIYVRIVNARDADIQSMANIDPSDASLYSYPSMITGHILHQADNVPTQRPIYRAPANQYVSFSHYAEYVDPPPVQEHPDVGKNNQRPSKVVVQSKKAETIQLQMTPPQSPKRVDNSEKSVGFIVDRVKDAPSGDGSLRLTGYHQRTGMVNFNQNFFGVRNILVKQEHNHALHFFLTFLARKRI